MMKNDNFEYDRSEDFSPEELYDEDEDSVHFETLEDKLFEIGMSMRDFL